MQPTATVVDEAARTIDRGLELRGDPPAGEGPTVEVPVEAAGPLLAPAVSHGYDLPDDELLAPHAPVRDRREAEQRLRELAMLHVELPTDDRERRIARRREAEQLGAAVHRLVRTPTTAPDRAAALANYRQRIGEVLNARK